MQCVQEWQDAEEIKVVKEINNTFNDGKIRNLVLEVNSKPDDLWSIIDDLRKNNIEF